MTEKKGVFITFEGIDGSGKSTQAALLRNRLAAVDMPVHLTKEPSDGEIGLLIRRILTGGLKCDERAIALLFAADRIEHLLGDGGVKQLLDAGSNVITDRCYLSSFAYQSVSMPLSWVTEINSQAVSVLKPDFHVFIDISPEVALTRIHSRSQTELFENSERLKRVRDKYFELFELLKQTENIIIVDGTPSPSEVAEAVYTQIKKAGRLFV